MGVQHREYRDVLMGTGAHVTESGGLLDQVATIFARNGESHWSWQQDGAGPHSVKDTPVGRETRRLIGSIAPGGVIDWPGGSPDLSPIENLWGITEQRLWAQHTWSTRAEFERELIRCWDAVTSDAQLMRKLVGGFSKRLLECIKVGGGAVKSHY